MIHDAYFKVRSIKEIIQKKDEVYEKLLASNRHEDVKEEIRLKGFLDCLKWLIQGDTPNEQAKS